MTFDFDRVIERRGTDSLKYDFAVERKRPADVLPLWVADMDFQAPPCVRQALSRAVEHGIFGYSDTKEDYFEAVSSWFRSNYDWQIEKDQLVKTPGVVYALAMAVRAATDVGDSVLLQPPVYYPFYSVIRDNGRKIVENPLEYRNGSYRINFEDLERKISENHVKLFLLCSPHNPVGRVWTAEELRRLGEICLRHGVVVAADEIHCDFTLPAHPYTPFANACPELAEQTIICTSPSKTFNLAGLQVSNIILPGAKLRRAFMEQVDGTGYSQLNQLGLVACKAAYQGGAEWLDAVRAYLRENLSFLRTFLQERIPGIRLVEPEGTYFAWLDCSGLGLNQQQLNDLVMNKARLWLDAGHIFGAESRQFQRVVLACPRSVLQQALEQLEAAVNDL